MPICAPNTTPAATPYRVHRRPAGDYAVQRFADGRIVRWGIYPTLAQAMQAARIANTPARPIAAVVASLS